jgi:actin-like ATPase involved in cell morphogenesis
MRTAEDFAWLFGHQMHHGVNVVPLGRQAITHIAVLEALVVKFYASGYDVESQAPGGTITCIPCGAVHTEHDRIAHRKGCPMAEFEAIGIKS